MKGILENLTVKWVILLTFALTSKLHAPSSKAATVPELDLFRNGASFTLQASWDLTNWIAITDLQPAEPRQFFRTAVTASLPFSFLYQDVSIRKIPFFQQYDGVTNWIAPLPDTWPYQSAEGIRLWNYKGELFEQPLLQSQYGLRMYDGYLLSTQAVYLAEAERYAAHVISQAVDSDGAWFFPYKFGVELGQWPSSDFVAPPYYDGMTEGKALSLFVHLFETTGKQIYRDAADHTFGAFKRVQSIANGRPWVANVDDDGLLWFQENASMPPQDIQNGDLFGLFGIYDYFELTGDPDALRLFQGGLYTARKTADFYRTPNWAVKYSRRHPFYRPTYQDVIVRLFRQLHSITGDSFYAGVCDQLIADFPTDVIAVKATLSGAINGFQFDDFGAITNSKAILFPAPTQVSVGARSRISEQPGILLRIDSGDLAGFWVMEFPATACLNAVVAQNDVTLPRKALFRGEPPSYWFSQFDKKGVALKTATRDFLNPVELEFDSTAVINSTPHLRICSGDLAGFWTPITHRTELK